MCWVDPFALVFFRAAEKRLKAAKALKEKGETPEGLLRSIKENEKAVAEAQRGSRLESHRRREVTQRGSLQGGSGAHRKKSR